MATGLEPLAIFGIACNVMQTISFAQLAVATYKQIREDGNIDTQLHKAASDLQSEATRLSTSIQNVSTGDGELVQAAKECASTAQKLVDELNKLVVGVLPGRQKVTKTISLGWKKWRKSGKIEKLEKELNRVQGAMENRILIRTCLKVDALYLQQQAVFSEQFTTLQTFIAARAQDHVKLIDLITRKSISIKDHITSQHGKTRKDVEEHTAKEHDITRTKLKDHVMNEHDKTREAVRDHTTREHTDSRKEIQHYVRQEHDITRGAFKDHATIEHENSREAVKIYVAKEHEVTRVWFEELTVLENKKTRDDVSRTIQSAEAERSAGEQQDRFLESLDFPGRAWRMNNIKEAHCRTFQWLFGSSERHSDLSDVMQDSVSSGKSDSIEEGDEIRQGDKTGTSDDTEESRDTEETNETGENDENHKLLVQRCMETTWDSFTLWLESDESIYWIKAKAGAGKSTLMKFLSEDPRTEQLLSNDGERSVIIISHSFFLLQAEGSPMQCNINGLLRNVIYQLVSAGIQGVWPIDSINQLFTGHLRGKTSCNDWGRREFRNACWTLLEVATESCLVCLFLDGLDELHPDDGKHELVDLLVSLQTGFSSLKMCVSSRPEIEFEQGLSLCLTLELHNLTAGDMYLYALHILPSVIATSVNTSPQQQQDLRLKKRNLALMVVEKAEGVFLWVDVATRSLQRGVTNGDSWDQMLHRLYRMPNELNKLFVSIWDRLGDDRRLYGSEVALYFNLVLDWRHLLLEASQLDILIHSGFLADCIEYTCWDPHEVRVRHDKFCKRKWNRSHHDITLFLITLASRELCVEDHRAWDSPPKTTSLFADCSRVFARLPVLSAGLLEFSDPLWQKDRAGLMKTDPDIEVRFIHRAARDFLTKSIEGQDILRLGKSSYGHRFSAILHAVLSRGHLSGAIPTPVGAFHARPASINIWGLVGCLHYVSKRIDKAIFTRDTVACQVYNDRHIRVHHTGRAEVDFLVIAISWCLFDYVVDVFDKPTTFTSEYKAYLLVSGIEFMPISVLHPPVQHKMINYLLQGCRPETAIVPSCIPYKSTGLEVFWHRIGVPNAWDTSDNATCDSVINTLCTFASSGADFSLPIYAFHDSSISGFFRPKFQFPLGPKENSPILIRWSIIGAIETFTRVLRSNIHTTEATYFCHQLETFVKTITSKEELLRPKIIAVGIPPREPDNRSFDMWLQESKRVPSDEADILLPLLTGETNNSAPDLDLGGENRDSEIKWRLEAILSDDTIPWDINNYLFEELGFAKSWPRFLKSELWFGRCTRSKDSNKLPDGVVYPPVKYIDNGCQDS